MHCPADLEHLLSPWVHPSPSTDVMQSLLGELANHHQTGTRESRQYGIEVLILNVMEGYDVLSLRRLQLMTKSQKEQVGLLF